ncbi:MAG: hypothetical protein PVF57_06835 [Pseudomonadales bacterium]
MFRGARSPMLPIEANVISTEITPKLVVHTAAGDTDLGQVTEATRAWYDSPDFDPDLPVLWDLRAATFRQPVEDVSEWSESNRTLVNAQRAGRKTAWVFPNPKAAEFAVELLTRYDFHHRVRIFHNDMEAAISWLTSTIR